MTDYPEIIWSEGFAPPKSPSEGDVSSWFGRMAQIILNHSLLRTGNQDLRPVETEFYYHGPGHPDPFTHQHPIQAECGKWYFHRQGTGYRAGSFKGLDLSTGCDATTQSPAFGGILLRGLQVENGKVIDGPSLCVDQILKLNTFTHPAQLDRAIANRVAWDDQNPLRLVASQLPQRAIYQSPRIGLNLKGQHDAARLFLGRQDRYLSMPDQTRKGKSLLIAGLLSKGFDRESIRTITRSSFRNIDQVIKTFMRGTENPNLSRFQESFSTLTERLEFQGSWHANHPNSF